MERTTENRCPKTWHYNCLDNFFLDQAASKNFFHTSVSYGLIWNTKKEAPQGFFPPQDWGVLCEISIWDKPNLSLPHVKGLL